ncbi:hypothetical protein [Gellertiella hungarica]|uniref:O-Antigen ligase n=1 Tax=Gellertiella hungarica TaxID=1572859 RepID=A0A7W6J8K5_9HYPH|nr:hypothetical protein [Gellertiella hungarica]MBB4066747.1 hypothetical protein [Gellertiella hungarica]
MRTDRFFGSSIKTVACALVLCLALIINTVHIETGMRIVPIGTALLATPFVFYIGRIANLKNTSKIEFLALMSFGLFILYFLLQAVIYPDWNVQKRAVGAVLFSIVPGFLFGMTVFTGDNSSEARGRRLIAVGLLLVSHALFVALISRYKVPDLWTVEYPGGRSVYQRIGDLIVLSFVLIVAIAESFADGSRSFIRYYAAVSVIAVGFFFEAQLAGSNAAAVIILAIFFMWTLMLFIRSLARWKTEGIGTAVRIACAHVLYGVLLVALVATAQPLRLFNYADDPLGIRRLSRSDVTPRTGTVESQAQPAQIEDGGMTEPYFQAPNSVSNRMEITRDLIREQLAASPIFGDLGVDLKHGGWGNYQHSFLSVQTHLGAVGSTLFSIVVIERLFSLFRRRGTVTLKAVTPVLLVFGMMATFFSWIGLWFMIGALYARPGGREQGEGCSV